MRTFLGFKEFIPPHFCNIISDCQVFSTFKPISGELISSILHVNVIIGIV